MRGRDQASGMTEYGQLQQGHKEREYVVAVGAVLVPPGPRKRGGALTIFSGFAAAR